MVNPRGGRVKERYTSACYDGAVVSLGGALLLAGLGSAHSEEISWNRVAELFSASEIYGR